MARFCEGGGSIMDVWVNGGLNTCFTDTLCVLLQAFILLALALPQALVYMRDSLSVMKEQRPIGVFRILHVTSHILPPLAQAARLVCLLSSHQQIMGYQILRAIATIVFWSTALGLVEMERRRQIPTNCKEKQSLRRHGLPLLLFWTTSLIFLNLPFVSSLLYPSSVYWIHQLNRVILGLHLSTIIFHFVVLKVKNRSLRMAESAWMWLFGAEYIGACGALFLVLSAPSLPTNVQIQSPEEEEESTDEEEEDDDDEDGKKYDKEMTWREFFDKMWKLVPLIWPANNTQLKLRVLVCGSFLLLGRLNTLYDRLYKKYTMDALIETRFCWDLVLISSGDLLYYSEWFTWDSVQKCMHKSLDVALCKHIHRRSMGWHLSRKSGEVMRVMQRGTQSVMSLQYEFLWRIIPAFLDIAVAALFFTAMFSPVLGLVVVVLLAVYAVVTVCLTNWRKKFSRKVIKLTQTQYAKSLDALANFETVRYCNNEEYEVDTFEKAIGDQQEAEWVDTGSMMLLYGIQGIVFDAGFLAGSLLCVYYVSEGELTVGDYTLFGTSLYQSFWPVQNLLQTYRNIQKSFIDMEDMLKLLAEKEDVQDIPDAQELNIKSPIGPQVEFRSVSFSYVPEKSVLTDVNFILPAGGTLGIVGESGSGKSTILRLLFRFYDPSQGQILVDGQYISMVQQKSLRKQIGVVAQDTVLFNDSIKYNIGYGRIGASEKEIQDAAKAADIHDRILEFPKGYETKVGERGQKLSGGEKQRVAIARTLLKRPPIVLLDEATSALDSRTEQHIQSSLEKMSVGRTTLIIAHRLSTIRNADIIIVIDKGSVAETGSHKALMKADGLYAEMWRVQMNEKKTEEDDPGQEQKNEEDYEDGANKKQEDDDRKEDKDGCKETKNGINDWDEDLVIVEEPGLRNRKQEKVLPS